MYQALCNYFVILLRYSMFSPSLGFFILVRGAQKLLASKLLVSADRATLPAETNTVRTRDKYPWQFKACGKVALRRTGN